MSNENNFQSQNFTDSESQSLKRDLFRYLKYWKWIVFGVIISLAVSFVYLRYASNIYQSTAKIKILKKKDSGLDLTGLVGNSPMFDMTKINLENEVEIILSRRIVGEVVEVLNLRTYYYKTGRIKSQELFGSELPFKVEWLYAKNEDISQKDSETFIFSSIDKRNFRINILDKSFSKKYGYGDEIRIGNQRFVIQKNPNYEEEDDPRADQEIYFKYNAKEKIVGQLLSKIVVEQVGEQSEVLEVRLSGSNILKNESILNVLIAKFNEDGIDDDKQVAIKTMEFVSERINMIESELDTVESNLVDYKRSNNFVDVESGSNVYGTYSEAEQKRSEFETQLEIAKFLQEEINSNSEHSLLPGNVGLQNDNTVSLISNYNNLVLERNKALTSATESSPVVKRLSDQLNLLSNNIKESIENYISSIKISLQNMSRRESQFNSQFKAIPEKQKVVRSIQRQQLVKENLYIFLLQKQVEADLSAAITAPTAKVVDYAFTNNSPISPKPKVVYLAGLVIGLAFPISILYLMYLFDTKVTSKEQVQDKLDLPIVAEIPLNKEYDKKVVGPSDNSDIAEAFRILRTNLSYLNVIKETGTKSKVFFSTSSTKGEGKTFTAINSASVFASNNRKTLLVGCDLRNPQLHNYLGVSRKNIGLTSYLVNPELALKDVLIESKQKINFDVILSGEIPPNPSELLNNGRLEELLKEAREIYDYIIVDTAPTMLVTDTLTIFDQADAVIYMVRTNFTELKILRHIRDLVRYKKSKNIAIAINAVEEKRGYEYNYGYGYGYYSDEEKRKKKWYQF